MPAAQRDPSPGELDRRRSLVRQLDRDQLAARIPGGLQGVGVDHPRLRVAGIVEYSPQQVAGHDPRGAAAARRALSRIPWLARMNGQPGLDTQPAYHARRLDPRTVRLSPRRQFETARGACVARGGR